MENVNGQSKLLAVVEHKNPKKGCAIYEDRIVFDGNTVLYDDIKAIDVMVYPMTYNFIAEIFSSRIMFKLKNGAKKAYNINGTSVFGIGNKKVQTERFLDVINKVYYLTAADVAKRFIDEIHKGNRLHFDKVEIDGHKAVFTKVFKKKLVIDKTNFTNYTLAENTALFPMFVDGKGKPMRPWTDSNMILMPYILTELYS